MARITKTNTQTAANTDSGQGKALPIIVVLSSLLLVALSVAGYFYYQYRQSPKVQSAEEIQNLKEEISTIFELPTDEEPTLATVTDREKLAEQPFFQKAENGDKVLIYSASGRAVLYRPSVKKIIDVTTVNVSQPAPDVPAETAPEVPTEVVATPAIIRVALYNGSTKVGVTNPVEATLRSALPNAAVVTKESAAKNDYAKTLVVDLTGTNGAATLSVASAVGGEVVGLPEGEKVPTDADILVIVGNDK
ncbi:MAG: hypothetical protein WAT81_05125 [Candidatus Moraniibacteriota bacterium]